METELKGDITFLDVYYKKKKKNNSCWQRCRQAELLYRVARNVKWHSHYGKQFGVPEKIINRTTIRSSNDSLEFMSKGSKTIMSRRYLQPHVHGHIVHNNQDRKTAQCSEADESIKKMWCIRRVECDTIFKKE